ncbi:MAG: tetratricopeptide repeat protein [bacterium]|nr:tetratricopeptide repeat protein [bacterium]
MNLKKRLSLMKKKELNLLAKELKVKNYSRLRKAKLITHFLENFPPKEIKCLLPSDSWWKSPVFIFPSAGVLVVVILFIIFFRPASSAPPTREIKELGAAVATPNAKEPGTVAAIPDIKEHATTVHSQQEAPVKDYDPSMDTAYYEKILMEDLDKYGTTHLRMASHWNNLGLAYDSAGNFEKAIDAYKCALAIDIAKYGQFHPEVAIDWNNIGTAWNSLKKLERAIDCYEEALAIDLKAYGDTHPKVATDWNNLGSAWFDLQQHEKAAGYFEKALAVLEKVHGNQHPDTQYVKANLEQNRKQMAALND